MSYLAEVDSADTAPVVALGALRPVAPRDVWSHEAYDFTPWLAANLGLLAAELGLGGLTLVDTEHKVGPFSLDILASTDDGHLVAIENQLEASDHMHLGQCITYAAGVGASSVVWVLPKLLDEHRAAFDWLNENTNEDVSFFGVELSIVRIGDSLPAPVFRVESRPNDWQKSVRSAAASSPKRPWAVAHDVLSAMPSGAWTTNRDVAALLRTSTGWVGRHFYDHRHKPTTLKIFNADGSVWKWAMTEPDQDQNIAAVHQALFEIGIEVGPDGPNPAHYLDHAALEELAATTPTQD